MSKFSYSPAKFELSETAVKTPLSELDVKGSMLYELSETVSQPCEVESNTVGARTLQSSTEPSSG